MEKETDSLFNQRNKLLQSTSQDTERITGRMSECHTKNDADEKQMDVTFSDTEDKKNSVTRPTPQEHPLKMQLDDAAVTGEHTDKKDKTESKDENEKRKDTANENRLNKNKTNDDKKFDNVNSQQTVTRDVRNKGEQQREKPNTEQKSGKPTCAQAAANTEKQGSKGKTKVICCS